MRRTGNHVVVLLTVVLALLGAVASTRHAHAVDHAHGATDCGACALGSSPVEAAAPASGVSAPDDQPSSAVTSVPIAPTHRETNLRSPRGPPSV